MSEPGRVQTTEALLATIENLDRENAFLAEQITRNKDRLRLLRQDYRRRTKVQP